MRIKINKVETLQINSNLKHGISAVLAGLFSAIGGPGISLMQFERAIRDTFFLAGAQEFLGWLIDRGTNLLRNVFGGDDCPFSEEAPPQLPPTELLPYLSRLA